MIIVKWRKKELELRDYEIEERNIWGDWHKRRFVKGLLTKTVPQIFIRDKHIGGYNDLMTYFEETTSNYGH